MPKPTTPARITINLADIADQLDVLRADNREDAGALWCAQRAILEALDALDGLIQRELRQVLLGR